MRKVNITRVFTLIEELVTGYGILIRLSWTDIAIKEALACIYEFQILLLDV